MPLSIVAWPRFARAGALRVDAPLRQEIVGQSPQATTLMGLYLLDMLDQAIDALDAEIWDVALSL